MSHPSEDLRALIARECETDLPPASVVEHGWTRLDAAVRAGVPADPGGLELDSALDAATVTTKASAITSTKLSVVVAAVVAGGVATWAATRETESTIDDTVAAPRRGPSDQSTDAEPLPSPRPIVRPPEPEHASAIATEAGEDTPADDAPATEPSPAPRPRLERHDPRDPADSLAAELALIEAARHALGNEGPQRALEMVRRHARLHPSGTLIEERRAIEALALCALGRPRGTDVALQFQQTYPRSTHIDRVRAACLTPEVPSHEEDER
jgi:hypothetical protein